MKARKSVLFLWMLLAPTLAQGQFDPPPQWGPIDPRAKRAAREKAVARLGPSSRTFIETHGESAVAATFACSVKTGRKLVEFHATGGLDAVPSPVGLLMAIAYHGDPVANFAMRNREELADVERFDVFCRAPMTYVLALKTLDAGVDEAKRRRERMELGLAAERRERRIALAIVAGSAVCGILIWSRLRRQGWL